MGVQCPKCGSRFLRESKSRDNSERFAKWRFISPLRCLDCKTRFIGNTLSFSDMMYAHCPKCERMDLNKWTGKSYVPPFWIGLWAAMGANRWRCEYCRLNFAGYRPRKEVFTFNRWQNLNSGSAVAEGRARIAEMEDRADEQRNAEEIRALAETRADAAGEARTTTSEHD